MINRIYFIKYFNKPDILKSKVIKNTLKKPLINILCQFYIANFCSFAKYTRLAYLCKYNMEASTVF